MFYVATKIKFTINCNFQLTTVSCFYFFYLNLQAVASVSKIYSINNKCICHCFTRIHTRYI